VGAEKVEKAGVVGVCRDFRFSKPVKTAKSDEQPRISQTQNCARAEKLENSPKITRRQRQFHFFGENESEKIISRFLRIVLLAHVSMIFRAFSPEIVKIGHMARKLCFYPRDSA